MKYYIITYGCQMNKSDSERIAAILERAGYKPVASREEADLLLVNSCSVRQSAIDRIYGLIRNTKKQNPKISAILTGCVLEADKKKLRDKFDLIIDVKELNENPKKLLDFLNQKGEEFKAFNHSDYFKINPLYQSKFSAYVPIMTGCNNFCSYCVVPYTRGREISRPASEIIKEVDNLIKKGYREITLLGQNVNSYKSEILNPPISPFIKGGLRGISPFTKTCGDRSTEFILNEVEGLTAGLACGELVESVEPGGLRGISKCCINFPKLLKRVNDIPGDFWLRFLTSHPKDMTDELIETIAKCEKVCEYVHLPIQSGDNEILAKMNRQYTAKHYLKLIKKIRKTYRKDSPLTKDCPSPAISTDIIVGFPGETKRQFENTAEVMRKVKFDMAYIAEYSPRPGTAAAKLKDNVSIAEKKRRQKILNEILKKTALANNKKYVGKVVEVLVEKIEDDFAYGKTRTFKNVRVKNPPISPFTKGGPKGDFTFVKEESRKIFTSIRTGQFVKVKITKADTFGLEGEII